MSALTETPAPGLKSLSVSVLLSYGVSTADTLLYAVTLTVDLDFYL